MSRTVPGNLDAEESLLGAMLLSREAIAVAAEHVAPADFYSPKHGRIFEKIVACYGRGEGADAVTVAALLHDISVAELISLQRNTPSIGNAEEYAVIVEETSLLRKMIGVGSEIQELGYSNPSNVSEILDRAENAMFQVAQRRTTDSAKDLKTLLGEGLDYLEALMQRGDTVTGVPTGYLDLDNHLAGLQPSNLVVVGARPSMGKTAFALGIAAHAAMRGVPTLFFSLEMSHLELTQRLFSMEARVDATHMRTGRLSEGDWAKLSGAVSRFGDAPLTIDDNASTTIMDIRAQARRLKAREGLGLLVVDYLQLMGGRISAENRQVEISEISRGLKVLARELDIPVMALSQLNRGLESRTDKRPMLSDLRESGAIEQDADVVMFIYRDEVYNLETDARGVAEVHVAKHRNGPTGMVELAFISTYARFGNMARI